MKSIKFSICVLFCILLPYSCYKDKELSVSRDALKESHMLKEYATSFELTHSDLINVKLINLEKSKVLYVDNDLDKPVLILVLMKANKLIGLIESVKLPEHLQDVLPNNNRYVACYRDYSKYSFEEERGVIRYYDMNYDNYLAGEIYRFPESQKWISHRIPASIKAKYSNLVSVNKIAARGIPCDGNGNGDLSFGECFDCYQNACNGNPNCGNACWFMNYAGIVFESLPYCDLAMGAACIYLSIAY